MSKLKSNSSKPFHLTFNVTIHYVLREYIHKTLDRVALIVLRINLIASLSDFDSFIFHLIVYKQKNSMD